MVAMDWLLSSSWTTTCLVGLTTLILVYWFSTRNHGYWKKQGIPFVKPIPFLGSIFEFFTTPIHLVDYERYFKYGPIYGIYEGNTPMLFVADPVLLRDIFVKDFATFPTRRIFETGNEIFDAMLSSLKGEDWKRIRSIVTPTFTTGKIRRMLSILTDCSKTTIKNFRTSISEGKSIDAKRLYGAFTMDVIASSAFSTKIDSHNNPDNPFVTTARNIFAKQFNWRLIIFLICPAVFKIFKIEALPTGTTAFFKSVTLQIIEERKRTGEVSNDFLQLLLDTAKEVEEEEKPEKGEDITSNYGTQEDMNPHILKTVTSKKLSMNELVAQCVIFFIAGYDTTASTLSFATYLLALNPDIQEKLRAEVDSAFKEANGEVTYEVIMSMKYLDNVISETLRMYPPVSRLDRQADDDFKLGNTGLTVTKGMVVSIPTYAIHRDPNFYSDPDKFDPDRFTPEERVKRDPYVFLPFGAGPRNCVAMRFALMEVKVCLAYVIANFVVKTCPETKIPLDFKIGQGILQPKGIILDLEIRKDSTQESGI